MKYHQLDYLNLLLFSIFTNAQINQLTPEEIKKIDLLFKKWDNDSSSGAAIGIIKNEVMQYSRGYGLANIEHKVFNTTQTAFNIGSNTKQFTAACKLKLITILVVLSIFQEKCFLKHLTFFGYLTIHPFYSPF